MLIEDRELFFVRIAVAHQHSDSTGVADAPAEARCAVGEKVQLLILDLALHIAASAVLFTVKMGYLIIGETDHEASLAPAFVRVLHNSHGL